MTRAAAWQGRIIAAPRPGARRAAPTSAHRARAHHIGADGVFPRALDGVHLLVGAAQQFRDAELALLDAVHDQADAGRDVRFAAFDQKRLLQRG